jgi:hypothetical protein
MKFIAHRGNYKGRNKELENHPDYIDEAIKAGFDVEVDVWLTAAGFKLGHDEPIYLTDRQWLLDRKNNLWCHAKSVDALIPLLEVDLHCFFHDEDDVTLTSKNYLWTYPGKHLTKKSIAVMPSMLNWNLNKNSDIDWVKGRDIFGICDDNFEKYI